MIKKYINNQSQYNDNEIFDNDFIELYNKLPRDGFWDNYIRTMTENMMRFIGIDNPDYNSIEYNNLKSHIFNYGRLYDKDDKSLLDRVKITNR